MLQAEDNFLMAPGNGSDILASKKDHGINAHRCDAGRAFCNFHRDTRLNCDPDVSLSLARIVHDPHKHKRFTRII